MSATRGTFRGSASLLAPRGLYDVSAGYVDVKLQTVRRMCAEGAAALEIAEAVGMSTGGIYSYVRRHGLVWNRKSPERHLTASAAAIGAYLSRGGRYEWRDEARRMREQGMRVKDIAEALGRTPEYVSAVLRKAGVQAPKKPKAGAVRGPSRAGMLKLIIRLHANGTLSEGQVANATGFPRDEVRRLVDEIRSAA